MNIPLASPHVEAQVRAVIAALDAANLHPEGDLKKNLEEHAELQRVALARMMEYDGVEAAQVPGLVARVVRIPEGNDSVKIVPVAMGDVTGDTSDGHHTFKELYEHRHWLFCNLLALHKPAAWFSRVNADGSQWDGWIVAGIEWERHITYHLPDRFIKVLQGLGITEYERGRWDGHDSGDVIERLKAQVEGAGG